jgi:periplasmic divalent cation tolerance protein
MAFLIFYTTHPSEEVARTLGEALLQKRLIACANYFPMHSAYHWQGALEYEAEFVAVLKTRLDLETQVETFLLQNHPYQTPCVLRWEARANADYERWIDEETKAI